MHNSSKPILPVCYILIFLHEYIKFKKQKLCQAHMKVFKNIVECYVKFIFFSTYYLIPRTVSLYTQSVDLYLFLDSVASP